MSVQVRQPPASLENVPMDGTAITARRHRLSGFTLIELLLVIAIVALLVSIILPSLGQARKTARLTQSVSNLKQFGTAGVSYSAEFRELQPSFSWQAGKSAAGFVKNDPNASAIQNPVELQRDNEAAAQQAAWIIARRANPSVPTFGGAQAANWFPYVRYSHLVLVDFLSTPLPGPALFSPFDFIRTRFTEVFRQTGGSVTQAWQSIDENTHGGRGDSERAIFSSSYQVSASAITPDLYPTGSIGLFNATQEGAINAFSVGTSNLYRLGGRKWTDARFPSQKVYMFEDVSWHVNPRAPLHYTNPLSVTAVALFDGSARMLRQNEAAPGGYATQNLLNNGGTVPDAFAYWQSPENGSFRNSCIGVPIWVGPLPDPKSPYQINMLYRFTVGGLRGVDIGKPLLEVASRKSQ